MTRRPKTSAHGRPHEVGRGPGPYHARMSDRLYFRQLLSGRDFAARRPVARQMVNFVYLIGDRETGEAVVVDPAYDVAGLLDVARRRRHARSPARSATHYHPDHVGGSMMGYGIAGHRRAARADRRCPIHVQADEAPWVQRVTGVAGTDLVAARQRRHRAWSARSRSS